MHSNPHSGRWKFDVRAPVNIAGPICSFDMRAKLILVHVQTFAIRVPVRVENRRQIVRRRLTYIGVGVQKYVPVSILWLFDRSEMSLSKF